jgi:hypothetical protein
MVMQKTHLLIPICLTNYDVSTLTKSLWGLNGGDTYCQNLLILLRIEDELLLTYKRLI